MSVDSDQVSTDDAASVADLGRELGAAIAELPEYEAFEDAKQAVESHSESQEKITEFEQKRQEFTIKRQTGQAAQEDVEELQRLQKELHQIPVMESFLDAQETLGGRLEDINRAISEPLAIDFGGEAGGCCHD